MHKLWPILLLFCIVTPIGAETLQITEVRDTEIDLIHPQSGQYLRTIKSDNIPIPIAIEKELGNGTYLVVLNGKKVCIDVGAVNTNKKGRIPIFRVMQPIME
jgi:hypothetical protein